MSSDGGATESVSNVWTSTKVYPYLAGVVDPYETAIADQIPQYSWTTSFTKTELAEKLRSKGYQCASIVDFRVAQYTPTGNVLTITFVDANGTEWSFSKEKVRTFLGLRSIRYEISGGGKYYVDGVRNTITSVIGTYAIDGSGSIAQVTGTAGPYVITSEGTSALQSAGNTFTIAGTGWGHNVGLSQWGAYSMAQRGYTYDQILKFYFTGIDID
jgi:stage II sporulation protein D